MARLRWQHRNHSESESPQCLMARGARYACLESLAGDPKPVDLCVGRLKPSERKVEDRTGSDVQIVRMTCA